MSERQQPDGSDDPLDSYFITSTYKPQGAGSSATPPQTEAPDPSDAATPETPKQPLEVPWEILLAGIVGVLFIVWSTTSKPVRFDRLQATVEFTGTQFVITNYDNFDWTDCRLDVNAGLFSSGFVYHAERLEGGHTYTVGALQFTNRDGLRFNPFTHKPTSFSLSCDTPHGSRLYLEEWK